MPFIDSKVTVKMSEDKKAHPGKRGSYQNKTW